MEIVPLPPLVSIPSWADQAEEEELQRARKRARKTPRNTSTNEEGKKIFVGGFSFSEDGKGITKKDTEEKIRRFSQIFYKFGKVSRIQGHWAAKYQYYTLLFPSLTPTASNMC